MKKTPETNGSIDISDVKIKLLHPDAKIPTAAHNGDVGYDVYAVENVVIPFGLTREIDIGIALECPPGYYFTVETRGGDGKAGKHIHRGVVDPQYRGKITVHYQNISTDTSVKEAITFKKGDRVAQLVFHQAIYVKKFSVVKELSTTERGEKRHGSSGR
jgi:dUTP pyrophosphatase